MVWVYLGLPLIFKNPDGLLMFPALYALFFVETMIEEKNDMCVRFDGQYQAYRQTTRRFGPIWLWGALVLLLLALVALGLIDVMLKVVLPIAGVILLALNDVFS